MLLAKPTPALFNGIGFAMSNEQSYDESHRRHFIPEWAEKRGKRQADIVRDLGIEKSTVYRWFAEGVIPTEKHLVPLAGYLGAPEVVALFRHPEDDWLARMFINKTEEQKEAAVQMLKLFFQQTEIGDSAPQHPSKRSQK